MRELFREFAAARERAADDYRRDLRLAWHIGYVYFKTRSDKGRMPELRKLLEQVSDTPSGKQSVEQVKLMLGVLSQKYRIPLRKRAKRTVH